MNIFQMCVPVQKEKAFWFVALSQDILGYSGTLSGSSQHPSGEKDTDLPVFLFKEAVMDLMTDSHDNEFFSSLSSDSPLNSSEETEKFPVKSHF